jgi:hypothetical protein
LATINLRYEWLISREITGRARIDDVIHSHNPRPFSELDLRAIEYDPTNVVAEAGAEAEAAD